MHAPAQPRHAEGTTARLGNASAPGALANTNTHPELNRAAGRGKHGGARHAVRNARLRKAPPSAARLAARPRTATSEMPLAAPAPTDSSTDQVTSAAGAERGGALASRPGSAHSAPDCECLPAAAPLKAGDVLMPQLDGASGAPGRKLAVARRKTISSRPTARDEGAVRAPPCASSAPPSTLRLLDRRSVREPGEGHACGSSARSPACGSPGRSRARREGPIGGGEAQVLNGPQRCVEALRE